MTVHLPPLQALQRQQRINAARANGSGIGVRVLNAAGQATEVHEPPVVTPSQSVLDQLTNDIRVWKVATLVLGATAVYFVASSWWKGRAVKKVRGQLTATQAESTKRAAAIEAARHALR